MKLADRWQACVDGPDLRHTLALIASRIASPQVQGVEYDRALIAEMLEAYEAHTACDTDLAHLESSILEQARLLREADEADAAGVHTAATPQAASAGRIHRGNAHPDAEQGQWSEPRISIDCCAATPQRAPGVDTLGLANKITKALHPDIYGKSGISMQQACLLMGVRGMVEEILRAELSPASAAQDQGEGNG